MLTTYPLTQLDSATMADFGDLHAMGLHFCDYTASSRGLTTANWGNRTIRTATRRRHANSQLLVLPNPHRSRSGGRRRDRRAWLRCPWAVAGPGCRARGRRRGLAGLRDDAPSEARGADGSRAGRRPRAQPAARPHSRIRRRPEHQRSHRHRHRHDKAGRNHSVPARPQCSVAISSA